MRALLRADRADDELAQALARAGLYVERLAGPAEAKSRIARGDVAVVDPRLLADDVHPEQALPRVKPAQQSLETLCYDKLASLLAQLGDQRLPALYETVLAQMERALLRVSLEREGAVAPAAEVLGIHRNTLARRLEALGLRERQGRETVAPRKQPTRGNGKAAHAHAEKRAKPDGKAKPARARTAKPAAKVAPKPAAKKPAKAAAKRRPEPRP